MPSVVTGRNAVVDDAAWNARHVLSVERGNAVAIPDFSTLGRIYGEVTAAGLRVWDWLFGGNEAKVVTLIVISIWVSSCKIIL